MRSRLLATMVCGVVTVLTTAWPGDVPWGGDDAVLIGNARRANADHRLAAAGLGGSFNVPYGPLPTQVYQGLLAVSGDLPTVVRLRAGLVTGVTAAGLLSLAASLGWSPWLAVLPVLSPFFWFYARLLWDNTFALPVGAMLLAGYADHLRRSSRAGLFTAAGCAAALPLIHPMTLPLVVAVAGHAAVVRRRSVRRHWIGVALTIVVVVAPSGPYLLQIVGLARAGWPASPAVSFEPDADGYARLHRPAAAAYPLLAGRLLSGYRFFDGRGPEVGWETRAAGTVARATSAVAFPLVVLGMGAVAVRSIRQARGTAAAAQPADAIATISLAALGLQSVLDGAMRVAPFPHYFCGTWPAAVVCLWVGLRTLGRWPAVVIGVIYGLSLAASTAAFAVDVHRGAGPFVWHMPTLARHLRQP